MGLWPTPSPLPAEWYSKFIKRHQGDNHESITGVLFTYQSTFVHILEVGMPHARATGRARVCAEGGHSHGLTWYTHASPHTQGSAKVIYSFLRDTQPASATTRESPAPVRNVKVLLFSDDIAQRYFSFWVGKAMEGEGQRGREVEEDALAWEEQGRTVGVVCA